MTARRVLYLIRNAQYDAETKVLTPLGIEQSQYTGFALRDLPVQVVYFSPYPQMQATAEVIASYLPGPDIYIAHNLSLHDESMLMHETLTRQLLTRMMESGWQHYEDAFRMFVRPPDAPDQHQLFICHGDVIRHLICRATGVNPATWAHMLVNNCGISSLGINPAGDVELLGYNDTGHMPDRLRT